MGFTLALDASDDVQIVGRLGSNLAKIKRAGMRIARGFILPGDKTIGYGISNEIMRELDKLEIGDVVLRYSPVTESEHIDSIFPVKRDDLFNSISKMQSINSKMPGAVIIQEYLDAELSGSIYSRNPYTGDNDEILIKTQLWANNSVLKGTVEPELILINKRDGAITLESEECDHYLDTEQIQRLYRTVRKAEEVLGSPVSLDWFFANGLLYILEAKN